MSPDDPRHGQERGYYAHLTANQDACNDCIRAHRAAAKRRTLNRWRGQPSLIDALGTQRRIQALAALGWSTRRVAEAAGWSSHATVRNMLHANQVRRANAEKIAEVYERLCMTVGPSAAVRRRAVENGWPPPLAWDDIDDPNEQPSVDILATKPRPKPRTKPIKPSMCGTERGYQRHRHEWRTNGVGTWPLPEDDPCGCRAAHRAWWHWTKREKEVA